MEQNFAEAGVIEAFRAESEAARYYRPDDRAALSAVERGRIDRMGISWLTLG